MGTWSIILMLKTLFFHPLGPALILALGGLLIHFWGGLDRARSAPTAVRVPFPFFRGQLGSAGDWRITAIPFAILVTAGAAYDLLRLRWTAAGMASSTALTNLRWQWQPLTVAGSELNWRLDGWNWLVAFLLLLLVASALLLQDSASDTRRARHTLWLGAAALAFVLSDNVITLASCWVLLDATLALRMGAGEDKEPAGRVWSMLSLSGLLVLLVLLLLGENGIRTTLSAGLYDRIELGVLWLAAMIRAGVYPFHLWLTPHGKLEAGDRVALHLIAPMTGLWLLARVHQIAGPGWLRHPEWAALGSLALLGSALAAWTAEEREVAWRWLAINRASLVVLTAYIADLAGPQALVWALVSFGLGLALLAAGQVVRQRWGWSWPVWLGALTVWGLPGTPGFLARFALVLPVQISGALLLFGIITVAEILLVATLWQLANGPQVPVVALNTNPRRLSPAAFGPASLFGFGALVILLAVPVVAWGLLPTQLGALLGLKAGGTMPTLLQAIAEARRSVWAVLVISGGLGAALGITRRRIFSGMRGWQQGISAIVGLEWLYQAIGAGFATAGAALRYFAVLGEGEGYLGWLLLAGLILWVLLRT